MRINLVNRNVSKLYLRSGNSKTVCERELLESFSDMPNDLSKRNYTTDTTKFHKVHDEIHLE